MDRAAVRNVWIVGAEFIVTGLAVLTGTSVFAYNFPEDPNAVLGSVGPRTVRRALAWIATLLPVATGIGLLFDKPIALYALIPAEIASLYLSIGNAWVFAVEIPRRMVAGDHVIDEEEISGFVMAGSPPTIHAVVVYQVQDGLIREVMLLM